MGEYKNYLNEKTIPLQLDEKFEEFKNKVFHKDITIFLDEKYIQRITSTIKILVKLI